MTDFNEALCNERHSEIIRRVATMEEVIQKIQNRPPLWASGVITFLASACTGLLVSIAK